MGAKIPPSGERWQGPGLINGGTAHSIKLVFWGVGISPVTSGIKPKPDSTPMSHQVPQRVGQAGGLSVMRAPQDWLGENVTGMTKVPHWIRDGRVLGLYTVALHILSDESFGERLMAP